MSGTIVRSFMLVDGKELIAQVLEETGLGYKIKSPLVIHMMRGPDGAPSLAFAPWSMIHLEGETVELLDGAMMAKPVAVLDQVEASYLTNVSGIFVPPAANNILLG
jgi:hypothetical protein